MSKNNDIALEDNNEARTSAMLLSIKKFHSCFHYMTNDFQIVEKQNVKISFYLLIFEVNRFLNSG